jgi:hypothetical protein
MTAREQLRWLRRLFPRAIELAVSRDLAQQYEQEAVTILRYGNGGEDLMPRTYPIERFATLTAQRFPMTFRGTPLTIVEPIV